MKGGRQFLYKNNELYNFLVWFWLLNASYVLAPPQICVWKTRCDSVLEGG